jgi:hypothetical protein
MLKVLKTNGTGRYYTSFIGSKQHVYCFKVKEDAEMCRDFILDYKKRHSMFPRINCGLFSKSILKDSPKDTDILIEDVGPKFETMCFLNKVGIVEVKYFNYTYTNSSYSINLSTSRLISNDELDYSIPNLNRLFSASPSIDDDSAHFGARD